MSAATEITGGAAADDASLSEGSDISDMSGLEDIVSHGELFGKKKKKKKTPQLGSAMAKKKAATATGGANPQTASVKGLPSLGSDDPFADLQAPRRSGGWQPRARRRPQTGRMLGGHRRRRPKMGMPARSTISDDATECVARTLMAFYKAKHP